MEMQEHPPVTQLRDVSEAVRLQPLASGDPRYVDISKGRLDVDLAMMRNRLGDFQAESNQFAKFTFTGHAGCGKSTELLRLEHDLAGRFTALHFYATEEQVIADYGYAELFLDLSYKLIERFQEWNAPLNPDLVKDLANWFAEVTLGEVETVKKEVAANTEGRVGFTLRAFGYELGLLAKVQSSIAGSNEKRREIRRKLEQDPLELVRRFNFLLDNAHTALVNAKKPSNLLIVVDNLDRLTPEVGRTLYFSGGDLLKMPRAHFIYTVPIATALGHNIGTIFPESFSLPMVKVRTRDEKAFKPGRDALVNVVKKRIDINSIFESEAVVRKLAESSGGSMRDLMRLIGYAKMSTGAMGKERIDLDSANRAAVRMRLDYERLLIPAGSYFPLLVRIHQTKTDGAPKEAVIDPKKVDDYRVFFNKLLTNGAVLEYNGGETWYDVHPVIKDIRAFCEIKDAPEAK